MTTVKPGSRGERSEEAAEQMTSGCSQERKRRVSVRKQRTSPCAYLELVMAPLSTSCVALQPCWVAWELRVVSGSQVALGTCLAGVTGGRGGGLKVLWRALRNI